MPLYMDVHRGLHGFQMSDIEQAHVRDLEAQDRWGVRYLRFFHNHEAGIVYCLVDAPSPDAARNVHVEANAMAADDIIEVDPLAVEGFLGGGTETPLGAALTADGATDGALRTIMFTDIVDSTRLTDELGDRVGLRLVEAHDAIVRSCLATCGGREVKHTGDGVLASFLSARAAVQCAVDVQRAVAEQAGDGDALPLRVRIGLNTGEPVAAHGDLYGLAVNIGRRVCDRADGGEILLSGVVRDLTAGKGFRTEVVGEEELKGIPEPVRLYRVAWSEAGDGGGP